MKVSSYSPLFLAGVFLISCASQTPEERAANYVAKGDAKMEQAIGDQLIEINKGEKHVRK